MNKAYNSGNSDRLFYLFEAAVLETIQNREKNEINGTSDDFIIRRLPFSFLSAIVLPFAALVYLLNVYRYHLERWDDAYITFRFAQHLANGQGLIWNIGGEPVEGFTSLLHVLLLAVGIKTGIDPLFGSLIISAACVLTTAALMLEIVRRQAGTIHPIAAVAIGIYLIDTNTALHTTSGLETQLFVLMLCAAYFFAFLFIESSGWLTAIGLGAAVFLSCLTRPEAVIYGAAVYFALAVYCLIPAYQNREIGKELYKLGASAALVIIGGLIYVAWKYNYLGYLLPNPYYVKSNEFSLAGLTEVAEFLKHLVKWLVPFAAASLLVFFSGKSKSSVISEKEKMSADASAPNAHRQIRAKLLLTLLPPFLALAYYCTIIHEVGGAYRFSYPTYFYFVLACGVFLPFLLGSIKVSRFNESMLLIAGIIVFGLMFFSERAWQISPVPNGPFDQYHKKIAGALRATGLGSKGTILCDAAGIIPYVSGFNQVDRVGLVDNFLSGRKPVTPAEREAYIWSRSLDVYIGYEPPAQIGAQKAEDDAQMQTQYVSEILLKKKLTLVESRVFVQDAQLLHARMRELRDHWIFVGEIKWAGWNDWKLKSFVYVRRDSPNAEPLISKLEDIIELEPSQINLNNVHPQ